MRKNPLVPHLFVTVLIFSFNQNINDKNFNKK